MVTMAFAGVNIAHPVETAAVQIGSTSPSVVTTTASTLLVFGEGSNGGHTKPGAPRGANFVATTNDSENSQAAIATITIPTARVTAPRLWRGVGKRNATVAGTVALRPATPPVRICGNVAALKGPIKAPMGAVTIPAGVDTGSYNTPSTTYWFAPGTHTLGTGEYDQIDPSSGDTYIGALGPSCPASGRTTVPLRATPLM